MTTTETAPACEGLADLYTRLEAAGANLDHLRTVTNHLQRRHNAEAARLSRLYFGKKDGEKITDSDITNKLEDLATRAYGVEAAVSTLVEQSRGRLSDGVMRLVMELAEDIDRLFEASVAEQMAGLPAAERDASRHGQLLSSYRWHSSNARRRS